MRRKIFVTFLIFLGALLLSRIFVFAQTTDECQSLPVGQSKVDCYANKVNNLQSQANTLSSQIAVMDNQISLTEARIAANEQQINNLTLDIDTANQKINGLQSSLDTISGVLLNRIKATYEAGTVQPFQILLSSNDANNFFSKLNYLKIAQEHDRQLILETTQAKNDYSNQKNILEDKKKQIEVLKKQQEDYQAQLAQEKQGKQALLAQTQGSEAKYRSLLEQAQAEYAAIQGIIAGNGAEVDEGHVNQGDVVAHIIQGASACSSGTHLHFEVHQNGILQNPSNFLSSKSVTFDNSPDGSFAFTGSWDWPIPDPIFIEQGFGSTWWAQHGWYPNPPGHTGIDMYSPSTSTVYAVKSGELFRGSISCGGGRLLYSKVNQDDSTQAYYLHTLP